MSFGNCHQAAVRLQMRMVRRGKKDVLVVQAVTDTVGQHSWCELDGMAYDNSNGTRLLNGGEWSPGRGVAGGGPGGAMLVEPIESYYERKIVIEPTVRRNTLVQAIELACGRGYSWWGDEQGEVGGGLAATERPRPGGRGRFRR